MNTRYTYILLALLMSFFFVPASAQTKKPATKKPAAKTVQKPAAKKKPAKAAPVVQKTSAKNLGDAASTVAVDTTKKGGQNNPANTPGAGLTEEIVVTTAYKPVLAEAVKIRRNPNLEEASPFKAPLAYAPIDKKLQQDNNIGELEAMKRPAEQDSVLVNNYVKVGAGSLKTTYAEGYFANGRDEALQVGGFLKHFAQAGNQLKQNEIRDEVGVFGKSIMADNTLTGRINYKRRGTYFYGDNTSGVVPAAYVFDPQKQTFNTIGAEAELAKNYKDVENDFTYALKLKGYLFSNAYKARENNLVLSGFVNQTVKQFYAGVAASLDLNTQKDALYSVSNSIVRANPYIKFQGENYKIDAGINIAKEFGFSDRFFIFPAAKLEYQVVPKYVRLFAEAKGDVNRASILEYTDTNPFLGENINLVNSVDQLDITVGLKGTLAPGLSFKAAIFRNSVKNLPLFVNDFANTGNKFGVIYDGGKARISGFNGELNFKAAEDFDLFGRVEFKDYKLATEAEPWNLPTFKLTAGTVIHISNTVDINGSLLFRGSTQDRPLTSGGALSTPVSSNIASFADLSGGATYKVNKKISVFVQVNNILSTSNQTWLYYPNYGLNVFGGVGYAF
jgi:outer membrane receptor protein involved in Fe transport